jgi:hypothetical protein
MEAIKERRVGTGVEAPTEEGIVQLKPAVNERIADVLRRLEAHPAFAGVSPSSRAV